MAGRIGGWTALVTGASSGIGAEIARELARHGAHLILVARRRERLETLAQELRERHDVEVRVEACDLGDPDALGELLERTAEDDVDILVNNAGLGRYDDFVAQPWDELHTQIAVNAVALTRLCRCFVPPMIERGRGHVMNVASIGAYTPTPSFAVYTATKAYVMHLSEALDEELRGTGVRVICINPGGTATEFMDHAQQVMKPQGELMLMPADRCAQIAVDTMLAGRRTVVTGWINALGMWLLRFVPRALVPRLARRAMTTAVDKGGGPTR